MKANTHPEYQVISVTCTCGNQFETGSTIKKADLHVDICDKCHPFYTGTQRIIDTGGVVDKFKKKFGSVLSLGNKSDK